jgi:putative N6-adenine-specific DNA methylase
MVIINPPYGHRMGTKQASGVLLQAIFIKLIKHYQGWKLAVIVPGAPLGTRLPLGLQAYPLRHGGLKLTLLVGKIPLG